jgi:SPP1 gp7 family putative phage head morphogenesis protein
MRDRFLAGRKAEKQYALQLRQVAKHVGDIVRGLAPDGAVANVAQIVATLNHYGDMLQPWAQAVATRMIADVARRDANAWAAHGKLIGQTLRKEIEQAPIGLAMQLAIQEQAMRITSVPKEAAQRIYGLTLEGITKGTRAKEIAAEIMRSGEVSKVTAMMLARTGVSTTATELTKARAVHIGSPGYLWRTSRDSDVRPTHRVMEGKFIAWNDPPEIDGYTAHCGEFANCRCWPEVQIPDKF